MARSLLKKIFVASALSGDFDKNIEIAKKLCRWILLQGYAPFAPHLIYTRFMDDNLEEERKKAIDCGMAYLEVCDELWAFGDITPGMKEEIDFAQRNKIPISLFPSVDDILECLFKVDN